MIMNDDSIYKHILVHKASYYHNAIVKYSRTNVDSPMLEIHNACRDFGTLDICREMVNRDCYLSKPDWKKMIWHIACHMEDENCTSYCHTTFMYKVVDKLFFLVWSIIFNLVPSMNRDCESMAKLVRSASLVKDSS